VTILNRIGYEEGSGVVGSHQNRLVGLYIFSVFDENIPENHSVLPGHYRQEEGIEKAAFADVADFP
jgi:hypothetical protein